MGNDINNSHAARRRRILNVIERRAQSGESLAIRAIHAEVGGSYRTISAVLQEYRDATVVHFLDGRAALSQDERERALREQLAAEVLRSKMLEVEVANLKASLEQANDLLALQRAALDRFEGQLSPIWREMMERVDMLRHLRVDDLTATMLDLKAQVRALPLPEKLDTDSRVSILEAKNQRLIQQVTKLTERNVQLERRFEDEQDR
jgi:hypothetical protein